jgi:hypothetical protein
VLGTNWNRRRAQPAFLKKDINPLANSDGWCTAVLANAPTMWFAVVKTETLPWFAVWKNTMALEEGYVPARAGRESAEPAATSVTRPVAQIAPGKSYLCDLELIAEDSAGGVTKLREEAARCQGTTPQKFHAKPQAGWSPQGDKT